MGDACKHPGCSRPKGKALGYCNAHYARQAKGKDMDAPIRNKWASDEERFWTKVDKSGTCWRWTGATHRGYGIFRLHGQSRLAHRVANAWERGEIPEGAQLDHMCHNRSCINPEHIRFADWETNGQNRARANKNSKTGIRGVYWNKGRNGWFAAITLGPDVIRRGPFEELGDAEKAAIKLRREHMPFSLMDRKKVS